MLALPMRRFESGSATPQLMHVPDFAKSSSFWISAAASSWLLMGSRDQYNSVSASENISKKAWLSLRARGRSSKRSDRNSAVILAMLNDGSAEGKLFQRKSLHTCQQASTNTKMSCSHVFGAWCNIQSGLNDGHAGGSNRNLR